MTTTRLSMMLLAAAILAGCGGGGEPDRAGGPQPNLTGTIVKGPVGGAAVCAYELAANGKGRQLGCTTTDMTGGYALRLDYRGPVLIEASGGTYTDEATGEVGVTLDVPLTVASLLDGGPSTVVVTPLTTIAMQGALRAGNLSLATFDNSLEEVKSAFGLRRSLDLVRSTPNVRSGSSDAYGNALVGVSKMLSGGASLTGIVNSTDLASLASAYRVCNKQLLEVSVDLGVNLGPDVPLDGAATVIDVFAPNAAWRAALPELNARTSCTVTLNTETNVRLSCTPDTALAVFGVFAGDFDRYPSIILTPSVALLFVHGDRVVLSGGPLRLTSNAAVYVDGGIGTVKMAQSVAAGSLIVNGFQDINSECRLLPTGSYAGIGGGGLAISTGGNGPSLSLGGAASNAPATGGQITAGGRVAVNGRTGDISLNGGSLSIAGSTPPPATSAMGNLNIATTIR